jgi:hypothetical protein
MEQLPMMDKPRSDRRGDRRCAAVAGFQPRHDGPDGSVEDVRDACLSGAQCLFDPELHDGPDRIEAAEERAARVEVAKQVCASCPVLDDCLIYVLFTRPASGVWAGYTAEELTAALDNTAVEDAARDDAGPAPVLGEIA